MRRVFFAPEVWSDAHETGRAACVAWLQTLRRELSQRHVDVVGIFVSNAPLRPNDDEDSHHTVSGTRAAAVGKLQLSQATIVARFDDYDHYQRSEAAEPRAEAAATAAAFPAALPRPHVERRLMRSVGMRPRSTHQPESRGTTTYEVRNYTFGEAGWAIGKAGYCRWAAAEVVGPTVSKRTLRLDTKAFTTR